MAVTKNVRKLSSESANELLAIDIAERDAQGRKIVGTYATKAEIPTTLPANGGNADYATTAGNADKCNNHTLGCDVPANADFTNTWPSAYIASISKSGNTLTITPNSGSALTFTNTTYSNATQSTAGLMSAADKKKLDGIDAGAEKNKITEIQVDGVTVEPDANGIVKITSSGGTTKYTHNITVYWSGGSGAYYRQGSLSFFFQDDNPDSYAATGLTEAQFMSFMATHCGMTEGKKFPANGTVQVGSPISELWFITNLTAMSNLWYVGGSGISVNSSKAITSIYAANEEVNYLTSAINNRTITLYDVVL